MAEAQKSLEQTPTWAVFLVATVFVVASLVVERGIKFLGRVREIFYFLALPHFHLQLLFVDIQLITRLPTDRSCKVDEFRACTSSVGVNLDQFSLISSHVPLEYQSPSC